jgi:hypothetical protein
MECTLRVQDSTLLFTFNLLAQALLKMRQASIGVIMLVLKR